MDAQGLTVMDRRLVDQGSFKGAQQDVSGFRQWTIEACISIRAAAVAQKLLGQGCHNELKMNEPWLPQRIGIGNNCTRVTAIVQKWTDQCYYNEMLQLSSVITMGY